MRSSSAVLTDTSVRLWDLVFPGGRPLLHRTRAAYIHLDNLIAHSKRDRDGKVDAFLACYRPDETVLLYFLGGDLVNASVFTPVGRFAVAISEALKHLRAETERAEVSFIPASPAQLATMYAACTQPSVDLGIDPTSPQTVFGNILERKWTGLLELISKGYVNYVTVKDGRYASGLFANAGPAANDQERVARIFTAPPPEPRPRVAVKAFAGLEVLPQQAPPAMVKVFRQFVWDLTELAEKDFPADASRRAERLRVRLLPEHAALSGLGGARGAELADPIAEPSVLADAVAAWGKAFLEELEVIDPQIAPRLLKEAGREQRYALAAVKFFDRFPWTIDW